MDLKEILDFINLENKRLKEKRIDDNDEDKYTLANMVKLNEEMGELSDAILSKMRYQRKEKLKDFDDSMIGKEIADVILATLVVAKSMNIDVEKSLEEKINIINERYK